MLLRYWLLAYSRQLQPVQWVCEIVEMEVALVNTEVNKWSGRSK